MSSDDEHTVKGAAAATLLAKTLAPRLSHQESATRPNATDRAGAQVRGSGDPQFADLRSGGGGAPLHAGGARVKAPAGPAAGR